MSGGTGGWAVEKPSTRAEHQVADTVGLDSELSQQLQRLSKKDPTTRLKSLNRILELITEKASDTLQAFIPPWSRALKRLVMDDNRSVRIATMMVMSSLAEKAGRGIAPYVMSIIPYWHLAQHDEELEVQRRACEGFRSTFPGAKAVKAVILCHKEVSSATKPIGGTLCCCESNLRKILKPKASCDDLYVLRKGSEKTLYLAMKISAFERSSELFWTLSL